MWASSVSPSDVLVEFFFFFFLSHNDLLRFPTDLDFPLRENQLRWKKKSQGEKATLQYAVKKEKGKKTKTLTARGSAPESME